jgi:hypothetical protein
MRFRFLLFALIPGLALTVTSCKKSEDTTMSTEELQSSLIREVRVTDANGNLLHEQINEYNDGRLVHMTVYEPKTGGDTIRFECTYQYTGTTVVSTKIQNGSGLYKVKAVYFLNASELADSVVYWKFYTPSDSLRYTYQKMQYTDSGYVKSIVYVSATGDFSTSYHYTGGNCTLRSNSIAVGYPEVFTYDLSHINTIGNSNVGLKFCGTSCRNPLLTGIASKSGQLDYSFEYDYDTYGRIVRLRTHGLGDLPGISTVALPVITGIQVVSYTYY